MRAYDHLFFDLDNTLWNFSINSHNALKITLAQSLILNQLPDFEDYFIVYETINNQLWDDYHHRKITKQKLIVERFQQSLTQFGITDCDWVELNRQYLENMAKQNVLIEGVPETLTLLQSRGYQMHIITNGFREVQRKKLDFCGLSPFFKKVFISEEIKTVKPQREIFEYAIKSVNAKKQRSIMIGDSWGTDILGARNFGIDQVMFLNKGQNKLPVEVDFPGKINLNR
jgi:putative hydrolase of the HAD superfamily